MATDTEINQLPSQDPSLTDVVPYSKGDLQTFKTTWQKIKDMMGVPSPFVPAYKSYIALLSQSGTNDPTVTVILNELSGDIIWTRADIGLYFGTLAGAFVADKTFAIISNSGTPAFFGGSAAIDSIFTLGTWDFDGNNSDDKLTFTPIEIRVYN